ncbi:hypothetical protein SOVF_184170 [Spinacia oleracea]|nr:hypothetical protein SOVF_184170 [Spinacia oleracea]
MRSSLSSPHSSLSPETTITMSEISEELLLAVPRCPS